MDIKIELQNRLGQQSKASKMPPVWQINYLEKSIEILGQSNRLLTWNSIFGWTCISVLNSLTHSATAQTTLAIQGWIFKPTDAHQHFSENWSTNDLIHLSVKYILCWNHPE